VDLSALGVVRASTFAECASSYSGSLKVCGRLYGRTYGSYSRRKLHCKVIGHPRLSVRS